MKLSAECLLGNDHNWTKNAVESQFSMLWVTGAWWWFQSFWKICYFIVIISPFWDNSPSSLQFRLFCQRIITEIDTFRSRERPFVTPRFTPKPFLRQGFDGHLMNHVIGQILIQIGQWIGILAQGLVLASEPVTSCDLPEFHQIHNIKRRNVVLSAGQVVLPVALLPEAESFHFGVRVTEWSVAANKNTLDF